MDELLSHPAADLFPLMEGDQLRELIEDIRKHGQRDPIVLYQGKILDGRNRLRACRELGIEPKLREWENGVDPFAWCISENLHRRHLTPAQCAAVAVELKAHYEAEAKERQRASGGNRETKSVSPNLDEPLQRQAAAQAAKATGASRSNVYVLQRVKDHSPETFEAAKRGELSVAEAARKATETSPPSPFATRPRRNKQNKTKTVASAADKPETIRLIVPGSRIEKITNKLSAIGFERTDKKNELRLAR